MGMRPFLMGSTHSPSIKSCRHGILVSISAHLSDICAFVDSPLSTLEVQIVSLFLFFFLLSSHSCVLKISTIQFQKTEKLHSKFEKKKLIFVNIFVISFFQHPCFGIFFSQKSSFHVLFENKLGNSTLNFHLYVQSILFLKHTPLSCTYSVFPKIAFSFTS